MIKIDPEKAVEIKPGVWWVGWPDFHAGFSNNPYLLLEGDEAVLFDPGSGLDEHWNWVKNKIESVTRGASLARCHCRQNRSRIR